MRELALRVVGKVLLFVAPALFGEEVAVPVPGKALVFVDQQPVAGPGTRRTIGDARALVAQQVEAGVGQAALDGLGPLVFLALALAAAVLRPGLDLGLRLLDARVIDQVAGRIEGKALGVLAVALIVHSGQQAADGVIGVAGAAAGAGAGQQLAGGVVAVVALDQGADDQLGLARAGAGGLADEPPGGVVAVLALQQALPALGLPVELVSLDVGEHAPIEVDLMQVARAVVQVVQVPPIGQAGLGAGAQAVVAVFDALGLAACMAIGTGEGLLGAQQAARVPFEVHAA